MQTWREYMRLDMVQGYRGSAAIPKRIVGCDFPLVQCLPTDDLSNVEFIGCDLSNLKVSKEQFLSLKSIERSKAPIVNLEKDDDLRKLDVTRADLTNVTGLTFNHLWQAKGGLLTTKLTPETYNIVHTHPDMVEYRYAITQQGRDPEDVPLGFHEEQAYAEAHDRFFSY